jgi:phosphoserine phosphatase
MELLFVRHGEVPGIDPPRFRGRQELALTPTGRAQADATATRIARSWRVSQVLSSPLGRCVETARAIASRCGAPLSLFDGLMDIDYGDWQWKSFEEVRGAEPDAFNRWFSAPEAFRFPNGESLHDLVARTSDVLRHVDTLSPDGASVLVGHDSSIRTLLLQLLSMPLGAYWRLAQSPCGISQVHLMEGGPRLIRMNETAHVEALKD